MSSESLLSSHEREDGEETQQFLPNSNNMEARAEHQKTKHYQSLYAFTTSTGVGLLMIVLFWILHYRGGFSGQSNPALEFNWHPFLMVLGMVFLYSQSILSYRTFRNRAKKGLKILHASLHCLAFILSVLGLKAVFDSHNLAKDPIPNLYSLHSWIGLITVIIFSAQFLFGFVSFLYPGLSKTLRASFLPVHTAFGTAGFVLAVSTTMMGIVEKSYFSIKDYSSYSSEGIMVNCMGIFTMIYGLMVIYLVHEPDFKRVALPDDEIALTSGLD